MAAQAEDVKKLLVTKEAGDVDPNATAVAEMFSLAELTKRMDLGNIDKDVLKELMETEVQWLGLALKAYKKAKSNPVLWERINREGKGAVAVHKLAAVLRKKADEYAENEAIKALLEDGNIQTLAKVGRAAGVFGP